MRGFLSDLSRVISDVSGKEFNAQSYRPMSGGCINQALQVSDDVHQCSYFVKYNAQSAMAMFEGEFSALTALAASKTIAVPRPIYCGLSDNKAFLVLEYIKSGRGNNLAHQTLGRQLAALHQSDLGSSDIGSGEGERFGWYADNAIGSTTQINQYSDDWVSFWQQNRLGYQFDLAKKNGYLSGLKHSDKVLAAVPDILGARSIRPSLLHGDLWSGNYMFDEAGTPFIFDPASYYGDPETDLAMTELFGGFTPWFYAAYRECIPEAPGYPQRRTLYNLYHILNHVNLFGAGYLSQAQQMMDCLVETNS